MNNDETRRASQDDPNPQDDATQSAANAGSENVSAPTPQQTSQLSNEAAASETSAIAQNENAPHITVAPAISKIDSDEAASESDEAASRDVPFALKPIDGSIARDDVSQRGDRFAGIGLPSGVTPLEDDEILPVETNRFSGSEDDELSRSEVDTSYVLLTGETSPCHKDFGDEDDEILNGENATGENFGGEYLQSEDAAFLEDDLARPEASLSDFAAGELVSGTPLLGVQSALETQDVIPSDNYEDPVFATRASEYAQMSEAQSAPAPMPVLEGSRDVELDVFAHLAELRTRILRCVAAVMIAMIVTWQFREKILLGFSEPMRVVLEKYKGTLTTTSPTEGFSIYLQITFISALLLTMPILLYQIWAFVEPALTKQERRYGGLLVPFSVLLFFSGSALGFWMSPLFFEFFLQFQPPGTASFWTFATTAIFLAKMLLAFGITFQVPVITIFLNKIGLVSRNWLIEYWRHVVCVIFIVVAIVTPTWDPVSLCAAAVPPCFLYGFSIWLVKWL